MIEEPVQPFERDICVDLLEHVERAADGFVVGRMHAPRPAVLREHAHDAFEIVFHLRREVRARDAEILEIGRRKHQHLARAVVAEVVGAIVVLDALGPVHEVFLLRVRLLREQVVGDAHRHLTRVVQLADHFVIVGIILRTAACVDYARHAKPVQFAHEVACRVVLILERQLRAFRERRVEDRRVRVREQQAGRVACFIAQDRAARRLGRVLRVADHPQRGRIQQRTVVQVQDEHRRIGCDRIEFVDRRQALLRELVFGEAADHAHPLRRRRDRDLVLQHFHRDRERTHAIPAQLEVVVQAAANHVRMVVDQARQRRAAAEVDDLRAIGRQRHDVMVVAHGGEHAVGDGDGARGGARPVEGREAPVAKDQVGRLCARRAHDWLSVDWAATRVAVVSPRPGNAPNMW
ncbi:MAG: hypothetical protein GAK33_03610 [Burkholderia lata]|uniref:Uncharacterized protein n=1 Tax=Burkholderia lata (strain ATCC 17760 / DSM 23089 / LMG 22485 / NCIMB 9086 / R18194 / 383) TaxID=482957 RepID=A0A833PQP8_BURL3|nr:MAG: hypothetical protein GAK33_03610 [Burkholderia lata]